MAGTALRPFAIGLNGVERLRDLIVHNPSLFTSAARQMVSALAEQRRAAAAIDEEFGLAHREAMIWQEHGDINTEMLATSLIPGTFLAV